MPTNFYVQYLAALDVIILAEGGTVPTVAPLNFQQADIARLDALVAAVDGDAPPVTLNYRSAAIARWQAAITGLSGTLPTVWVNFEQALLLHVQALQAARGVSTAIAGQNFQETLLGLLDASAAPSLDFSALPNLPSGRQSSDGWINQATIDSFANAAIWLDAYNTFSDVDATVAALTGDGVASIKDNAAARTWTENNAGNRMTLAATPTRLTGDFTKTVRSAGNTIATGENIIIATNAGILNAVGNIPATLTVRNIPGMIHWVSGALSSGDIDRVKSFVVAEGAIDNDFAGVTNFSSYFRGFNFLTSFPLIDTSNGTNFANTWFTCTGLTSFPLIDTSSGTNFTSTWRTCTGLTSFPLIDVSSGTTFTNTWNGCSGLTSFPLIDVSAGTTFSNTWFTCTGLTSFPANFFDGCAATNFANAFVDTALTEASIDGILVSINSNGTSNGTFNQSGGTAPSVATGQPAIDAMRGRGWTVTVTGGY